MNRIARLWFVLVLCVVLPAQENPGARSSVLKHVTIISPNDSRAQTDMTVVITGNRIAAVGRADKIRIPKGADVIEGQGKFVIPGLADMHNHLGTGFVLPGPPVPGTEAGPELRNFQRNLAQMLGWGFTTIFSTSHSSPNLEDFSNLRRTAMNDAAAMPRFFGVGRAISVKGGHGSQPAFASYLPEGPEEVREEVRAMRAAGVDAIKLIYSDQTHTGRPPLPVMKPEILEAAIDEAHKSGLRVIVHAPTLRHAKEALRAGADALAHSVADAPVDQEFLALMKRNRATYTSTLSLYTAFADVAGWMRRLEAMDERKIIAKEIYARYETPAGAARYHAIMARLKPEVLAHAAGNLKTVHDAGIPVLAGTDTGVSGVLLGVSSQMELVLMVDAGLTPREALQAATINAARFLGLEKHLGSVDTGKVADLVVLDADPLADMHNISKIYRVVKAGVVYDPAKILAEPR
jgi:imidazolonepropionase-like amidohydrolase